MAIDYEAEYKKCVEAASVFQSGGELAYLLGLGQSITLDGPKAAAAEIKYLKKLVNQLSARVDNLRAERNALHDDMQTLGRILKKCSESC